MSRGTRARAPDVGLLLADDLGCSDLGCYGGERRTPALDRLARQSVRAIEIDCARSPSAGAGPEQAVHREPSTRKE